MNESPLFVKFYDLMAWLLERTVAFPRNQRGVLARQIQQELFRIHELLVEATGTAKPLDTLYRADRGLIRLRTYLRLSRDLKLLSSGQFEHVTRLTAEVGRLLGGWIRHQQAKADSVA